MAVHGPLPVTVNTAGDPSDAFSGETSGTPPPEQVRLTDTGAGLFGTKSFKTVIVLVLASVLMIVQLPFSGTPTQLVWFAL